MEQNREARNRSHNYSKLVFDKGAKITHWRMKVFSINSARAIGQLYAEN